jgi:hypothetical protein
MLIRIGYDIALRFSKPTAVIHLLRVHPSRWSDLVEPERFSTEPPLPVEDYYDSFTSYLGDIGVPPPKRRSNETIPRQQVSLQAFDNWGLETWALDEKSKVSSAFCSRSRAS